MKRYSHYIVPRLAAACFSALIAVAAVARADESPGIQLDDGLLTVEIHDAPISAVIRAIGEQAGFDTIVVGEPDTPVSASFADVPIREALDRLLGDTGRIVLLDSDGAVSRLWLLGPGDEASDGVVTETGPAALDADPRQADARRRSEEVLGLANLGATEPVLEALARSLLDDEQALVRSRAAIALGKLGDRRAVPALESALSDEHGSVRAQAIHALGLIGGESATLALGDVLLHGTDSRERIVAAQGLTRMDSELAQQYLDAVADDPDRQIRAMSARSPATAPPSILEIPAPGENWGTESIR